MEVSMKKFLKTRLFLFLILTTPALSMSLFESDEKKSESFLIEVAPEHLMERVVPLAIENVANAEIERIPFYKKKKDMIVYSCLAISTAFVCYGTYYILTLPKDEDIPEFCKHQFSTAEFFFKQGIRIRSKETGEVGKLFCGFFGTQAKNSICCLVKEFSSFMEDGIIANIFGHTYELFFGQSKQILFGNEL